MKTDTPTAMLDAQDNASSNAGMWRLLIALGLLAFLIGLPLLSKNFFVFQLTLAMVYAIAILGLNLLTGFNGQFSLGHGAFYAIGA
ncbi:MAG TPA: branched-chain amino acid ABC transporter permease, partial [Xanthobacteraceae bacterium]|nr:branched-chain amino acid ABC transporter permease [Xanthobacteraceae bacterium]